MELPGIAGQSNTDTYNLKCISCLVIQQAESQSHERTEEPVGRQGNQMAAGSDLDCLDQHANLSIPWDPGGTSDKPLLTVGFQKGQFYIKDGSVTEVR